MAKAKRRVSRRAQTSNAEPDGVTSAELAEAVGVTVKTVRRWYQVYRLIPPPQIVRNAESRGTHAVWPRWVIDRGRRIKEVQATVLSLADVRTTIEREDAERYRDSVEATMQPSVEGAREAAARVMASDRLIEIVRARLIVSLSPLAAGRYEQVESLASKCSRDESFLRRLFLFAFTGFSPVCYVDPMDLTLSLATNITVPWLLSGEAAMSRAKGAARSIGAATVFAFNLTPLLLQLGHELKDGNLVAAMRGESAFRPAPLVWFYMTDGGIAEYALSGSWRDDGVSFLTPARRFVSPADATLFRTPASEIS